MKEYHKLIKKILKNGELKDNRTNIKTISIFGHQAKYNLKDEFPLLTTKKLHLKSVLHELLWFLKGDTNIKYLVDNNVRIWNEWAYENFTKTNEYNNETIKEFVDKVKTDTSFAKKFGNLGPIYGKQWRDFNGVDQVKNLIEDIKKIPFLED